MSTINIIKSLGYVVFKDSRISTVNIIKSVGYVVFRKAPYEIDCEDTIGFDDDSFDRLHVDCIDTIGFSEFVPDIAEFLFETIGFSDSSVNLLVINCIETIGFSDSSPILHYDINCEDTIGFNDGGDEKLAVYCEDTIGFNDTIIHDLTLDVHCIETIGYGDGGYSRNYAYHDITFTWRTRTKTPSYGYGGSEYGNIISYGDGDAVDLVSFEIHIWKLGTLETDRHLNSNPANEFDNRLIKVVIPITDTANPDLDATYTLTAEDNVTLSGGEFTAELEAEVYAKDINGVYSFPKVIVTKSLKVDFDDEDTNQIPEVIGFVDTEDTSFVDTEDNIFQD